MTAHVDKEAQRAAARQRRLEEARKRLDEAPHFTVHARRNCFEDAQLRLALAAAISSDSCCVDVGAHGGDVLREFRRLAPAGTHVAFEPIPALAERLADLYPDVQVHQVALADETGEATFTHVRTLSPRSGLRRQPYPSQVAEADVEELTVPVRRLDDMLPDGFAPAVVKVDVEGAEELVLRGAARTIETHRPMLVLECNQVAYAAYDTSAAARFDLLAGWGYRVFDLAGDGPYSREEFIESQAQRLWVNYFARAGRHSPPA